MGFSNTGVTEHLIRSFSAVLGVREGLTEWTERSGHRECGSSLRSSAARVSKAKVVVNH